VHDPSRIVLCGDRYWVFATGQGIRTYSSVDLKVWSPGPPVFTTPPAWHRETVPNHRGHLWAPDILKLGHRYRLYYSVSAWGKNTSAIGLATNSTLDPKDPEFAWKDDGVVIKSSATNDFNAIDPAVILDERGRVWMTFGSFWSGIKLVQLDAVTGHRLAPEGPVHSLAHTAAIEAPYLHHHGGNYYLFVNWGLCCRGTNSTYEIRMGRSPDILGPYLDRDGRDLLSGGGTLLLGSEGAEVGPGHASVFGPPTAEKLTFHLYDARHGGRPTLGLRDLAWTADGWPSVGPKTIELESARTLSRPP
jgi:arabinan endo-1,5-alpha-L-arabinosidase